ncbi:glycosyl transferase [Tessaracoccus sp. MC1627]|nr:glycosyl transferase [Tessaracoccus sp. MC1627]
MRKSLYRRNTRLKPQEYRRALTEWFRLTKGWSCNLDDPQKLSEKIQWLKLYDSTPMKGQLADKYLVREWVEAKIGAHYLVPLVGVWGHDETFTLQGLPKRFALKATHGSGWNVIVEDRARLRERVIRKRVSQWMNMRKAMTGGFELHYEFSEPRVIAEAHLADDSGGLRDYKFMMIHGELQFILAIQGRYTHEQSGVYDGHWRRMPFDYGYRAGEPHDIARPKALREMVEIAETLSSDFPLVRVDFYEVDGRVYFGEVTFTPGNGLSDFDPIEHDSEFGSRLNLPEKKTFKGVML